MMFYMVQRSSQQAGLRPHMCAHVAPKTPMVHAAGCAALLPLLYVVQLRRKLQAQAWPSQQPDSGFIWQPLLSRVIAKSLRVLWFSIARCQLVCPCCGSAYDFIAGPMTVELLNLSNSVMAAAALTVVESVSGVCMYLKYMR